MTWSNDYIGLPFAEKGRNRSGVDCWGLARLVLAKEHGVALPSYAEEYVSLQEREEIGAILAKDSERYPWRHISTGAEVSFDIALFRRGGVEAHVGIIVECGLMLHVEESRESTIERYDGGKWRTRLVGFYRHADLMR